MSHFKSGKIKFFKPNQGWGFIIPDEVGVDVQFHINEFSGLSELRHGELGMELASEATLADFHPPRDYEPVIYEEINGGSKGPKAAHWLYLATLAKAQKMLSIRPGSPQNFFVRVLKIDLEERWTRPNVFWKGTYNEFYKKLEEGFPEMFDEHFTVEKLEINSMWCGMWHPCDWHPGYRKPDQEKTSS